jgi:hypothetical protein
MGDYPRSRNSQARIKQFRSVPSNSEDSDLEPARADELMFLECGNAVGNIAIINVHRVDLTEAVERCTSLAGHVKCHGQVIA